MSIKLTMPTVFSIVFRPGWMIDIRADKEGESLQPITEVVRASEYRCAVGIIEAQDAELGQLRQRVAPWDQLILDSDDHQYHPFGPEWHATVKRMRKDDIIAILHAACIQLRDARDELAKRSQ